MKNLTVLGVGSAGCRITGILQSMPGAENLRLLGFDCDAEALRNSGLPEENLLLAGVKWRQGRGCGGRINEGKTAAAAERESLSRLLEGTRLLIVLSGLGRGFGSGAMSVVQSVTSRMKIPTVFLVTTPFIFEGVPRCRLAEKTIKGDLTPLAGAVVTIPNDLLFNSTLQATVSHEDAFAMADRVLAQSAIALAVTLCSGNRLAADYDTLSALLCRKYAVCTIGHAAIDPDEPERDRKLIEKLLDSPMLGGSSSLKQADAVFMALNGGENLALVDARSVFENLQKYAASESEILVGAGADSSWGKEMQLVVITVKFEQSEQPDPVSDNVTAPKRGRKKRSGADDEFQPDLFSQSNQLGIMEGTNPVIVDGVNLDVPTFMRKQIPVGNGE
ncbi:MAG: hypothetical protein E7048_01475 [Lentisphaerae bacterium]|nr:hypothetical protein [Lentisphaerota bacterium]